MFNFFTPERSDTIPCWNLLQILHTNMYSNTLNTQSTQLVIYREKDLDEVLLISYTISSDES